MPASFRETHPPYSAPKVETITTLRSLGGKFAGKTSNTHSEGVRKTIGSSYKQVATLVRTCKVKKPS